MRVCSDNNGSFQSQTQLFRSTKRHFHQLNRIYYRQYTKNINVSFCTCKKHIGTSANITKYPRNETRKCDLYNGYAIFVRTETQVSRSLVSNENNVGTLKVELRNISLVIAHQPPPKSFAFGMPLLLTKLQLL